MSRGKAALRRPCPTLSASHVMCAGGASPLRAVTVGTARKGMAAGHAGRAADHPLLGMSHPLQGMDHSLLGMGHPLHGMSPRLQGMSRPGMSLGHPGRPAGHPRMSASRPLRSYSGFSGSVCHRHWFSAVERRDSAKSMWIPPAERSGLRGNAARTLFWRA